MDFAPCHVKSLNFLLAQGREEHGTDKKNRDMSIPYHCEKVFGLSNANIAQRQGSLMETVTRSEEL